MSHDPMDWPGLSYREQFKERDEEADRGNDGKTTSKRGPALNGTSYYGKPRTVRSGGSWLYNLQWRPKGQLVYGADERSETKTRSQAAELGTPSPLENKLSASMCGRTGFRSLAD